MKKRLLCVTALAAVVLASHAQSAGRAKNANEIEFIGYTIRLFQTPALGYRYDVFLHNNIIIHQQTNPFTNSPDGLRQKDDAIKAAKWQIIHLSPAARQAYPIKETIIPVQVGRQLKITTN